MYREIGVIKSGGIELCGMKTSLAPRRQQSQAAPKLEKYSFIPFNTNEVFLNYIYTIRSVIMSILYFFIFYFVVLIFNFTEK